MGNKYVNTYHTFNSLKSECEKKNLDLKELHSPPKTMKKHLFMKLNEHARHSLRLLSTRLMTEAEKFRLPIVKDFNIFIWMGMSKFMAMSIFTVDIV